MTGIPFVLERTRVSGTRPGLHPSMVSEQPPPPWAGLLLDRTRPPAWVMLCYEGNGGIWTAWKDVGETIVDGSGSHDGPRILAWSLRQAVLVNGAVTEFNCVARPQRRRRIDAWKKTAFDQLPA